VTFSLAGGFEDSGFNLLSLPNSLWSVGAGAAMPLFDGGLRRAQLRHSWAQYAQTRDNYRATVLAAFQEVEDGLSQTQRLATEDTQEHQASDQAAQALSISTMLYKDGLDNYLSVAVAQVQALASQLTEVQIRMRQIQAAVSLIRALGGGWTVQVCPPKSRPCSSRSPITACPQTSDQTGNDERLSGLAMRSNASKEYPVGEGGSEQQHNQQQQQPRYMPENIVDEVFRVRERTVSDGDNSRRARIQRANQPFEVTRGLGELARRLGIFHNIERPGWWESLLGTGLRAFETRYQCVERANRGVERVRRRGTGLQRLAQLDDNRAKFPLLL
jgi:hypothetical protein